MKNWQKICLLLVFLLALGLRLWNLEEHPTFISDEASLGYNAYSILKTGKDEWGNLLPLSFKAFGEYKLPVYIYLVVPSVVIFGLNEFAVRFPSALFGALTVLLVFFLTKEILSQKKLFTNSQYPYLISFLASMLLAISPWHIQVSRMALEANVGLFVTIAAVFFLLRAKLNPRFYYFSFFLFAFSFYTYNSFRVFSPLFLLAYFLRVEKKIEFRSFVKPLFFGFFLLVPVIFSGFTGSAERLYKVGIFNDPELIDQINKKRGECLKNSPKTICVLRYNKAVSLPLVFIKNYFSHFSLNYLFTNGSGLAQYGVPGQGVLYPLELPFLLLGIISLLKFRREFLILLLWLILAPIPNSITGPAHPVRAILMLPVFQIFSAAGIASFAEYLKKMSFLRYIIAFSLILAFFIYVAIFLFKYFIYYPQVANWNWQSGYNQLYLELEQLEQEGRKIYISKFYGEPHIFYLFYRHFDPKQYQQNDKVVRYSREDRWINVDRITNYYFVQEPKVVVWGEKDLLVVPSQEFSFQGKIIGRINYLNGQTAFLILSK